MEITAPSHGAFVSQLADPVTLREAWHRVQRGGRTPGVDAVTVQRFAVRADQQLQELRRSLLAGTYVCSPLRRIEIPKASGGLRLLGVPTVTDRIGQTAAAMVLHDRVAGMFSGRSYAYRPFLGPRRAALTVRTLAPRAAYVVTADIAQFFDNVEHRILAAQLQAANVDPQGVSLIQRWLLAPVRDGARQVQPIKGLPQGSPLSPVLANLYLNGFDTSLEAAGFGTRPLRRRLHRLCRRRAHGAKCTGSRPRLPGLPAQAPPQTRQDPVRTGRRRLPLRRVPLHGLRMARSQGITGSLPVLPLRAAGHRGFANQRRGPAAQRSGSRVAQLLRPEQCRDGRAAGATRRLAHGRLSSIPRGSKPGSRYRADLVRASRRRSGGNRRRRLFPGE